MTSLNDKPVRTEALKYYRRVADHYKLDIRQYQHVSHVSGDDGAFVTHATDVNGHQHQYGSKKVIFSTGYYDVPNMLNVPGEHLPKVIHYYKDAHPYYNQDVLVVGAKNSAAIGALELLWAGARVTLVHRGAGIHQNVKYWIKPNIENRIKNGEIRAFFRSRVVFIDELSAIIDTPEGGITLKNDFVFAMTGYRPDLTFLEAHGIRLDPETQRPYTNPETLESDRKGIYLAGVLVAGMHTNEIFIENGRFHGKIIAEAISAL
jgi:thioredoxin reductase (NADPH)